MDTYEQKYKEVLERARIWQNHLYDTNDKDYADELNYIFPELKESEDERIKKTLIEYIKGIKSWNYFLGISREQMIAWLEKQGEQSVEPKWCHHKVDLSDCSEEYRKAYYDGWNNCNMQHSQCEAENKDEGEKIRKELITHCRNTRCVTEEGAERIVSGSNGLKSKEKLDADKVIAWLVANICDFEYYVKWFKQDFELC